MQELEKILGEIKEALEENKVIELNGDGTVNRYIIDVASAWGSIKAIIHNHINDGWIPVEERLPEEKQFVLATWEKPNYRKNVTEIYISILKLIHDKEWYGDCGIPNGKVTAWRPLPEPYRPERSEEE